MWMAHHARPEVGRYHNIARELGLTVGELETTRRAMKRFDGRMHRHQMTGVDDVKHLPPRRTKQNTYVT